MIYPDGGRGWGNRDRFLRKAEWQRIVLDRIKSFTCTGKRGERTEVGNEKFPSDSVYLRFRPKSPEFAGIPFLNSVSLSSRQCCPGNDDRWRLRI